MKRPLSYAEALCEGLDVCLDADPRVIVCGLGVPDPKGIFGSTSGLHAKYGPQRVMDMPLSENAMTGILVGAALTGMRPVITHQRVDFALTAMEQMVNQAAKWHYMFNGKHRVPLVIRMVVGRGWGQGPQHSQSLQAMFGHVPGLKVVMPTTAHDAKGMLIGAVADDNPVIMLEHRWLYGIQDDVPEGTYTVDIERARVMHEGGDITIVATSYMSLVAMRAATALSEAGVGVDLIDLRSVRPLDTDTILASVAKTGRLLVVDTAHLQYGVTAEILALASERAFDKLRAAPQRMGLPDYPTPTSPALAENYYPRAQQIAEAALKILGQAPDKVFIAEPNRQWLDQPDPSFTGPF